jgi:hypothetical protein
MSWYHKVSQNLAHLPSCIDYFNAELAKAKVEVKLHGSLEKAAMTLPGIVEYRFNQLQEIEGILEYMNIELRRIKSKTFRKYLENYNRDLSSRDCEKFAEGDAEVIDMEKLINEVAMLCKQWEGITKGLETKGFQINNIIKLRVAGLEDITL